MRWRVLHRPVELAAFTRTSGHYCYTWRVARTMNPKPNRVPNPRFLRVGLLFGFLPLLPSIETIHSS
jgi:hypothetical protein